MDKTKSYFDTEKKLIVGNNEKITFQMKKATIKKLMSIFAFAMVLVGCAFFTVSANASSKESVKTQVLKELTGVKSGSYTYYIHDNKLYRVKSGKKAEMVRKNVAQFQISGNYVYYVASNKNCIYRIAKDGKNPKLIGRHGYKIINIQDGYVYYSGGYGHRRVTTGGKKETKILGYGHWNATFYNGRIYYSELVRESDVPAGEAYVTVDQICSKALDGSDKKRYVKNEPTQLDMDFTFYELNGILYAGQQGAEENRLYRLNDTDEFEQLSIVTTQSVDVIYTDDTYAYVYNYDSTNGHEDRNDGNIYRMDAEGKQELFLDLKSAGIYVEEVYTFRKESNYWILYDTCGDSDPIVYIFNTNGKLIKTLEMPKELSGDEAYIEYAIKGKTAYVKFSGDKLNQANGEYYPASIYKKITLK